MHGDDSDGDGDGDGDSNGSGRDGSTILYDNYTKTRQSKAREVNTSTRRRDEWKQIGKSRTWW